jgi:hypothetical protein
MRGRPFQPGNKFGKGRPRGSRNKRTLMTDAIKEHGEAIVKQCVVMALKGNPAAMKICMDWLARDKASTGQHFRLLSGHSGRDLPVAIPQLIMGIAKRELSSQEAITIVSMLEKVRNIETQRSASVEEADVDVGRLTDDEFAELAELYRKLIERKES